jgi:hypothetical protein
LTASGDTGSLKTLRIQVMVLATVQVSGGATVPSAIPNIADGTVSLALNGKAHRETLAARFVVNHAALSQPSNRHDDR